MSDPRQPDDEMEALPDGRAADSPRLIDRALLTPLRRIALIVAALWPWRRQARDAEDELIEEPPLSYPRPLVPIPEAAAVVAMAERATVRRGKREEKARRQGEDAARQSGQRGRPRRAR